MKDMVKSINRQVTDWKEIFVNTCLRKDCFSKDARNFKKSINKKTAEFKNGQKTLTDISPIQMAKNKCIK